MILSWWLESGYWSWHGVDVLFMADLISLYIALGGRTADVIVL